jgi:hypothetical protein
MTTIDTLATPTAVHPLVGALSIPVGLITPSPLNPRKRWAADKVAAMSADMAINGQIQPIRVRPNAQHTPTNGRPPYEIVVGETRWRAAPGAGMGHLDAETWDKLMAADAADLLTMTAQGAAIERKHRKDVAELVRTCRRRIVIADHLVLAASLPHTMASDAGEAMCQGEPFAAVYWDTADHRQFSLRSRDGGLDVALVAQGFGGGGHRNAAGFRVARDHALARM